ncbi:MAG: hypothetical protein LIP09_04965 [Bacteroidales bacterium]|nr:hypothetical protein [Bacteroidales bacterium]
MGGPPPARVMMQLLMFKQCWPHWFRFWSVMLFALFYQLTGGVYVASLSQIVGELAFINEDVTMASYCSLIGLNIIFPMLFRWKFYFFTRQMFFVSSIGSIVMAIFAMYVNQPWLFCLICFFAGYFKMMGMFNCISTAQLCMTPTRNFGVFLPVIYLLVCGGIMVSGIISTVIAYVSNWKLMYCFIVVIMLIIDAIVYFCMKPDHRSGPYIPLKGIDWLGQVLWAATSVSVAWVFNYGEHYDWWYSQEIWTGTWIMICLLAVTLVYQWYKKDKAYIPLAAFQYKMTGFIAIAYFGYLVMQSVAHIVQPAYVSAVLGYDSLNSVSLNVPELIGIGAGAILAYWSLVNLKWNVRQFLFANFIFILVYVGIMYFIIGTETAKYQLYVPLFCFGVALCMIETIGTWSMSQAVPFPHFFMNISILGFVRCGPGNAMAAAIVERVYSHELAESMGDLSSNLDLISDHISSYSQFVVTHAMPVAMKETYGHLAIFGVLMLIIVLVSNYKTTIRQLVPRLITVARNIRTTGHD